MSEHLIDATSTLVTRLQAPKLLHLGYTRFVKDYIEGSALPGDQDAVLHHAACSSTANFFTSHDALYAWGTALAGEFLESIGNAAQDQANALSIQSRPDALPMSEHRSQPSLVGLQFLSKIKVTCLACGPHHVMVAPDPACGKRGILTWGLNLNGRVLGTGGPCGDCLTCGSKDKQARQHEKAKTDRAYYVRQPSTVAGLDDITVRSIATAVGHTVVLDTEGQVYTWGHGASGQLGVGLTGQQTEDAVLDERKKGHSREEDCWALSSCRPIRLQNPREAFPVRKVAAGAHHSLTLGGPCGRPARVWSWGHGLYHALGHGSNANVWTPEPVQALDGIVEFLPDGSMTGGMLDIAAGGWYSVALSSLGDVYAWGWNKDGQLGSEGLGGMVPLPRLLHLPNSSDGEQKDVHMIQIGCGMRYTAALSEDRRLYIWGTLSLTPGTDSSPGSASATSPRHTEAQSSCHHDESIAAAPATTMHQPVRESVEHIEDPCQIIDISQTCLGQLGMETVGQERFGIACGAYHMLVHRSAG